MLANGAVGDVIAVAVPNVSEGFGAMEAKMAVYYSRRELLLHSRSVCGIISMNYGFSVLGVIKWFTLQVFG